METKQGYVEKLVYRNTDNGYTVFELVADDESITCVGTLPYINEGEYLEVQGDYIIHPSYHQQLQVKSCEVIVPEDELSMIRYLGSGAIKGIKIATATKIVNRFKEDTFRIMEEEPERLAEIKGISVKKAMEIAAQMEEKKDMRKAMLFLSQYGIGMALSIKIYNRYGQELYQVVKTNPYKLADDIEGIGFKIVDEIARQTGIQADADFRISCGIQYALQQSVGLGHVCLPYEELQERARELLGLPELDFEKHIMDLAIDKRIVIKEESGVRRVYGSSLYFCELGIARYLTDLNIHSEIDEIKVREKLRKIEEAEGLVLDELQEQAILEAVRCGLLVITGGPGTGKTTTINTIIKFFESEAMDILLAAPTGRAAKRMTEATGHEAKTIHRLLEINGSLEEGRNSVFGRNEENPLETDVLIIDEMSMVDIFLMQSLLKAITVGTRLILVGDVNQLPSVGPGNVLKDIIASQQFPVVCLTKIFRQAATSDIVMNAHKINGGEPVDLAKRSKDFLFIRSQDTDRIVSVMLQLLKEKLPPYVDASVNDIQVLTPSRKGALGVEQLNRILQKHMNPPQFGKIEKEHGDMIFREGDKVMQIKNDYELEWEQRNKYQVVYERGLGVFNGDTGIIRHINTNTEYMEVEFDEGRYVTYSFKQLEELELAYAITIHKSQGSEYPAVIMPMYPAPRMLMNRNLLYTAVTRAKKCVCLVGLPESFFEMLKNYSEQVRYSGLCLRISELCLPEEL